MRRFFTLLPLAVACLPAMAVQVVPTSYSLNNGTVGAFSYFDDLYTGTGCKTCSGAALSGGLGDLTDGVLGTTNWNVNNLPWVGWSSSQTLTFNFVPATSISSVAFRLDDSNFGGVAPPASVTIGGQTFPIADPVGAAPFTFTVTGLSFVGSSMPITLTTRSGNWMMLSEVTFQSAVPEPAAALTLLVGLAGLSAALRLQRRRPTATA